MDAEEGDMEMDVEMAAEEPADDMDMEMDDDMGMEMDDAMGGDKEEQFADIVNQLAELVGVVADVGVDGEEEEEMEGEVEAGEGGDLEMADSAPEDEEEEVEMMGEEEMIAEVARRVKARLLNERKKDAMATKLADRIFNRLVSK